MIQQEINGFGIKRFIDNTEIETLVEFLMLITRLKASFREAGRSLRYWQVVFITSGEIDLNGLFR